jgi:hypothetical protein
MDVHSEAQVDQKAEPTLFRSSSLRRALLLLDRPFQFAARLTSFGAVGVILASIIQYSAWRDEKNLARHHEELTNAISNYSEISGALSADMNLQQILYFTYKNALGYYGEVDDRKYKYLFTSAKSVSSEYANLRTKLREEIDVLTGKADLFIDRPTTKYSKRASAQASFIDPQVFSNRDLIRKNGFDCTRHLPDASPTTIANIVINWQETRYHVWTLYFCLEERHSALLPMRIWASQEGPQADQGPKAPVDKMDGIEKAFDLDTKRLDALILLASVKIEEIRLRSQEDGFFRHQFCVFCSN